MNIRPCIRIVTQARTNDNCISAGDNIKFTVFVGNVCEVPVLATVKTIITVENSLVAVLASTLDGIEETRIFDAQAGLDETRNGKQRVAIPSSLSSCSSIKEVGSVTLDIHSVMQSGGKIEFTAQIEMPGEWLDSKTVIIDTKPSSLVS
jgi:hypothetical protein